MQMHDGDDGRCPAAQDIWTVLGGTAPLQAKSRKKAFSTVRAIAIGRRRVHALQLHEKRAIVHLIHMHASTATRAVKAMAMQPRTMVPDVLALAQARP